MKRKINKKEISSYQKHILNKNEKGFMCTEKLVLDYNPKKEYVIHYLTPECYIKLGGFNIKNIYYIIKFNQSNYMRKYIQYNHKLRCETDDKYYEKMYKLISNSLCELTLSNKEQFTSNIRIIAYIDKAKNVVSKDTFKDYHIVNESSALFNIEKQYIKLDSPNNIGSCILDLSKILIYNYWYKLKDKYKHNIRMMYIDTDGFLSNITNHDVYKDMYEMDIFHMSYYDKLFKYCRPANYEMGKIRDE